MTVYLSENIKGLRLEKGLTQETLSEFLRVTSQSVSNWERGESYPDITMFPEIAGFFKVRIIVFNKNIKYTSKEFVFKKLLNVYS